MQTEKIHTGSLTGKQNTFGSRLFKNCQGDFHSAKCMLKQVRQQGETVATISGLRSTARS